MHSVYEGGLIIARGLVYVVLPFFLLSFSLPSPADYVSPSVGPKVQVSVEIGRDRITGLDAQAPELHHTLGTLRLGSMTREDYCTAVFGKSPPFGPAPYS